MPARAKQILHYAVIAVLAAIMIFSLYKIVSYYADLNKNKQQAESIRELYYSLQNVPEHAPPAQMMASSEDTPVSEAVYKAAEAVSVPSNDEASGDEQAHASIDANAEAAEAGESEAALTSAALKQLAALNEDTVGWVTIKNTNVDYPIVQAEDNDFYLYRGFDKKDNVAGSIFMDYRNDLSADNKNVILYGHNMKNGTMFADLLKYESRWNFDNRGIISLNVPGLEGEWRIFSAYFTDIHHDYIKTTFNSDEEYAAFLDEIKALSLHETDIDVNADDMILTLSTCSSIINDEQRFAVHAVKISD